MPETGKPLSQKEVSELLGVSPRTVQAWHKMGLPRHNIGARVRYFASEVLDWIRGLPPADRRVRRAARR